MRRDRLHPGAWWLWALLLAAAASRTTDVLLLALVCAVAWVTVVTHGGEGSGKVFRLYVLVAVFVLAVRIVFRVVLGGGGAGDALFTLPQLTLPDWAVGIRIGGPVTGAELTAGLADGARLATLIVCVGAANALADPRRLLRSLPLALHSVGTAVVVAIGLVPQLIASTMRVRRAAALRSVKSRRLRLRRMVGPVVDDAVSRTLSLAVSMEARGFGQPLGVAARPIFALTMVNLTAVAVGLYLVLARSGPIGPVLLASGLAGAAIGLRSAGRRRSVTIYRKLQWGRAEWGVTLLGLVVLGAITLVGRFDPGVLHPVGLAGPPLIATLAVLAAAAPAFLMRGRQGRLQPT